MPSSLKTKEEILIVGGLTTSEIMHKNSVSLDRDTRDCIMTQAPICAKASHSSACVSKDTLIVSGGYDESTKRSSSKVQKFSLHGRKWINLPDLPFPVEGHGSTLVDEKLYTIGGCYQENSQIKHRYSSVNVLDLASLSWEECQSLPNAVNSSGIAAVEENIYTIRGYNGKEWSRQTIKLNTQTGAITQCLSMPKGDCCAHRSTVIFHHQIFVLDKRLFAQYDVMKDQWTVLQLPLKPSFNPAMVLRQNHLVMLGGFEKDEENPNDDIQKYDMSSKRWSLEKRKMPLPLSCHWAFVMDIPQ